MSISTEPSLIQMLVWITTIIGAGFAIWKYFAESAERRLWEKARLAKQMLDDLDDNPAALSATYMLGAFTGKRYTRPDAGPGDSFEITQAQVAAVLDPQRVPMSLNESYVRACFDDLLYHIELCVAAAYSNLVEWREIESMLVTLFAGIERPTLAPLVAYAQQLHYFKAADKLPELVENALSKPPRPKRPGPTMHRAN
jgi:hypothetical protein